MSCNNCSNIDKYNTENLYTWCTNCGNYGINGAIKRALVSKSIKPHEVLMCFDIGCNGNGADKISSYTFHGLHGRVLPFAVGSHLANPKLPIIASAGDGATLGEGINHLVHTIRGNYDIMFILHNNSNYGLTTGQASPSTPEDVPMNSSPDGVNARPINIAELALSLGTTFYARGFSGNVKQLTSLFELALDHRGFSFVEVLQDCPTYNKATDHNWYMERLYDIDDIKSYDNTDIDMAKVVVKDLSSRIATGLIYHDPSQKHYYEKIQAREGLQTTPVDEVHSVDITSLVDKFR